jgi:hypothetical protein
MNPTYGLVMAEQGNNGGTLMSVNRDYTAGWSVFAIFSPKRARTYSAQAFAFANQSYSSNLEPVKSENSFGICWAPGVMADTAYGNHTHQARVVRKYQSNRPLMVGKIR